MVFCFASGCCTRSAWAIAAVLIQTTLEERAILAAPSPEEVLRDYLKVCLLLRRAGRS